MISPSSLLPAALILQMVIAQDSFMEKYTYAKAMSRCFGQNAYLHYIAKITEAEQDCKGIEHEYYDTIGKELSAEFPPYIESLSDDMAEKEGPFNVKDIFMLFSTATQRPKPQGYHIFSSIDLEKSMLDIRTSISNFTCIARKIDIIDDFLNINYRSVLNFFIDNNRVEFRLRQDLRDGVNLCREKMMCVPDEASLIPIELRRLLSFIACEKRTRLVACFRNDIRQNLHQFDLAALPDNKGKTSYLVKLMAILMGADTIEDLEFI